MSDRDSLPDRQARPVDPVRLASELSRVSTFLHKQGVGDGCAAVDDANAELDRLRAEVSHLRAGISWARGMCSDEKPHAQIDHFLGCVLAGKAQAPELAESVYEVWMPREQYDQIAAENGRLRGENERLREDLGERDDFLFLIGKLSRAYEDTIHLGSALQSDEDGAS